MIDVPENRQTTKKARNADRRTRETTPKKIGALAVRDVKGRFVAGAASPNPGGRPAIAHDVREFAGEHSIEALRRCVHILRTSKDHSTVLAAARTILDRAIGKPQQIIAGANGGSLVNINLNGSANIITAADAEAAYQALCADPSLDAGALTFAPERSERVACPELPPVVDSIATPASDRQSKLKLWETLGK